MASSSLARFGDESASVQLHVVKGPAPEHGRAVVGILQSLFDHGQEWAAREMVLDARPEDIEALSAYARAIARATPVVDCDPQSNGADRERANLFDGARAESRRLSEAIRNRAAKMHGADLDALAKNAALGERPPAPLVAMIASAAFVAMTIAPSIHDLVFSTLRNDVNWMVSFVLAGMIGTMLVWGLVAESSNAPMSSRTALWGGILVGVGFAILRLSAAEDLSEMLFAVGLSVIEIGALVFADWLGTQHRTDVARWNERQAAAADASAQVDSSRKVYEQLVGEKAAFDQFVQHHLAYADERRELSGDFATREAAYVQAACAGYRGGIAHNIGRAQGYDNGA